VSPATQSGAPPPRERPASNDSSRDQAARQTQSNRPGRRSAATWAQRHRSRIDRIFTGRDPWTASAYREWTDAESRAFELAAEHLRNLNLYGCWQCPKSASRAWRCQRCPCHRDAA
jgi:hypothetical protein